MIEKITESKAFISEIIEGKTIESVIVLGSGMSGFEENYNCLLYTSPSPRDRTRSRMPSSA